MTTMFTLKDLADAVDNVCENGDQRDEIVAILRSLEAQPQQASKSLTCNFASMLPMRRHCQPTSPLLRVSFWG